MPSLLVKIDMKDVEETLEDQLKLYANTRTRTRRRRKSQLQIILALYVNTVNTR